MTVTYEGKLTLGECIPTALEANAQLSANVGLQLPELQAKIAGALEAQARLTLQPPTVSAQLTTLANLAASLQASVAFPPPQAQLSAVAALVAELQASLGQLQASIAFSAGFAASLGAPGVHFYSFGGRPDELGDEIGAQLSSGLPGGNPSEQSKAIVLIASDGGAIAAMEAVLR